LEVVRAAAEISQGLGALEMLNIMAQFPLASWPSRGTQECTRQIEAQKLAFRGTCTGTSADPRRQQGSGERV